MSNKTLYLVTAVATCVITAALLFTAIRHGLWKEFFVSEAAVVSAAAASLRLLRIR